MGRVVSSHTILFIDFLWSIEASKLPQLGKSSWARPCCYRAVIGRGWWFSLQKWYSWTSSRRCVAFSFLSWCLASYWCLSVMWVRPTPYTSCVVYAHPECSMCSKSAISDKTNKYIQIRHDIEIIMTEPINLVQNQLIHHPITQLKIFPTPHTQNRIHPHIILISIFI